MTKLLPIIAAVVAAGGLAASGCTVNAIVNGGDGGLGDDGGVDSATSGDDTGTNTDTGVVTDSGTTDAPGEAAAPSTNVRLANLSPDAPSTGYDFCLAPHGTTTWSGPQLAGVTGDAGSLSLAFPNVTTYFQLDPGAYDLEIVAAGASDCTAPIGTAVTNLPNMTQDNFFTVAFVGDTTVTGGSGDPALTAIGFQDDPAPASGINIRFLNVAPQFNGSITMDFGTGGLGSSTFVALETNVAFATLPTATSGDAGTVGSNGYLGTAALTSATEFSAHTSIGGTADTATIMSQMISTGSATIFLINGKTGGAAPGFLVCQGDTTSNSASLLSNCATH